MFRTCDWDEEWLNFFHDIGSSCPYIPPSLSLKKLLVSIYDLSLYEIDDVEFIFYVSLVHSEILRKNRLTDGKIDILLSENLVFLNPGTDNYSTVLDWPHYLLKKHYTHSGLMFGKFFPGEEVKAKENIVSSSPPSLMLPIRSSIRNKDERFFAHKTPELLTDLRNSSDYGEDLLPEEIQKSVDLVLSDISIATVIELVYLLEKKSFFESSRGDLT